MEVETLTIFIMHIRIIEGITMSIIVAMERHAYILGFIIITRIEVGEVEEEAMEPWIAAMARIGKVLGEMPAATMLSTGRVASGDPQQVVMGSQEGEEVPPVQISGDQITHSTMKY